MEQATITIDLYNGDRLVRRTDIPCPARLDQAAEVYDRLRTELLNKNAAKCLEKSTSDDLHCNRPAGHTGNHNFMQPPPKEGA